MKQTKIDKFKLNLDIFSPWFIDDGSRNKKTKGSLAELWQIHSESGSSAISGGGHRRLTVTRTG
jgi:hypothetical protein